MPKSRKQLGWSVPKEAVETFKRAVFVKWGKWRGVLGDELAQAMENHVSNHMFHAHTHTSIQISPNSPTYKRCLAVFRRLKSAKDNQGFSKKEFGTAIRTTLGFKDPRTIQGYQDQLCELGWIAYEWEKGTYSIIREPDDPAREED